MGKMRVSEKENRILCWTYGTEVSTVSPIAWIRMSLAQQMSEKLNSENQSRDHWGEREEDDDFLEVWALGACSIE